MARILVIDDDDLVCRTVSRALELDGHEVESAGEGKAAMKLFEADPHDLVLTDVNMPEMDGIEVLRKVRAASPGTPVVVISGGGAIPKEMLLENADLLGAVTTMPKPFTSEELRSAVRDALESSPE